MEQQKEPLVICEMIKLWRRGKKGIWTAEYWHNGKHHRKSLGTRNQKVAEQEATKLAARILEGTLPEALKRYPVTQAMNDFIEQARLDGRDHKTIKKYETVFKGWIGHLSSVGVTNLQQIRPEHYEQYRRKQADAGIGGRTIHNHFLVIKQLMNWAKRHRRILDNPLHEMRLIKPKPKKKPVPTLNQVNQILNNASARDLPVLALAAFAGGRIGDIRTRHNGDIDLQGNWVHFLARDAASPKGGKSRKVPIHPRLKSILIKLVKGRGPWLFTAKASKNHPYGDHHLNAKLINERFKRIVTKLGMKAGRMDGFTTHSLRRFFETHCINHRVPQRVVDIWMGHSDRSMGAYYYALNDDESQAFMKEVPFPE
jgi:integrase